MTKASESVALIAPFATWMALMLLLPAAPWAYAVRTAATLGALLVAARGRTQEVRAAISVRGALHGAAVGLVVLALWILPENFAWYRSWCILGTTANAPVDSSAWFFKAIRLFGSAFVISVAEELFFRRWLLRFAGFFWMVALFAVEHDRWLVAAIAGALYGALTIRRGLFSAIVAHAVTNLALGVYVLLTENWNFW